MRSLLRTAFAGSIFLLLATPPMPCAQMPGQEAVIPNSLADRRRMLNQIFQDYWESLLERNPEFASAIGDKRFRAFSI